MFLTIILMVVYPIISFILISRLTTFFGYKTISLFIFALTAILSVLNFFAGVSTSAWICLGIAAITSICAIKIIDVKKKFSKKIADDSENAFLATLSLNFTIALNWLFLVLAYYFEGLSSAFLFLSRKMPL